MGTSEGRSNLDVQKKSDIYRTFEESDQSISITSPLLFNWTFGKRGGRGKLGGSGGEIGC